MVYETIDTFLDMLQYQYFDTQNKKPELQQFNYYSDRAMVLKKPAVYAEMLEMFLEEVNDRICEQDSQIEDWQIWLLCKSLTVKRIIGDKSQPQLEYFLRF